SIFIFLSLIGFIIFAIIAWKLQETLKSEHRIPSSIGVTIRTMRSLLNDRSFIGYALVVGFVHGCSFAYVSGTPFIYQDIYGVSPQVFSVLFGINALDIITGSFLIGRLGDLIHEKSLLQIAVTINLITTFLLLIMT